MIRNASAAILCGGKSRRMGFDKAFLTTGEGLWLLEQLTRQLKMVFDQVIWVTNSVTKFGDLIHVPAAIVPDRYPECGPLGAICTAFHHIEHPYLFVLACDMPELNLEAVKEMHRKAAAFQVTVYENPDGTQEPLFAFYHQSCQTVFEHQLQQQEFKIRKAWDQLKVGTYHPEHWSEWKELKNLNTTEDVRKWGI